MPRQSTPSAVATVGIDIGKNTFHLVGLDQRGAIVLQLKSSREQLERRLSNMPRCLIGMEACSGSHHIGRQLEALGHDVRLIPAQYVKPFLKGHKNDYRDAEAIAEAMQRPTMTFVTIKTPAQMDLLALHRVRSRLVSLRTGVINQIRGFLIERGITVRACQRLLTVPGIGPIISSAVVAAIGDGAGFKQGRDFGAWLGLVPRQESTGDRTILGKISKRGNKYLRTLFVQAAHVILARRPSAARRGLWPWIEQASKRLHRNMLAIAPARIAWAVLARGREYRPMIMPHTA